MSLPTFTSVNLYPILGAALGYAYGKAYDVSPSLCAKIMAISSLANSMLYLYASLPAKKQSTRLLIYACTSAIVHTAAIVAFKHFNLIAKTGTVVLSFLAALNFIHICHSSNSLESLVMDIIQ